VISSKSFKLIRSVDQKWQASKQSERASVLRLHLSGWRPSEIFKALKNSGIKQRTIYSVINRYKNTGTTDDKKSSGRLRTRRTKLVVKAVRERIRRNPHQSQRKLAQSMNMSQSSMKLLLRDGLKVRPFKQGYCHFLNNKQMENRKSGSKALLSRYAGESIKNILFFDEKIFTVESKLNKQNDRVYEPKLSSIPEHKIKITRSYHPLSVMVWCGAS
jgi:winged helix-turn helix protein